MDKQKQLLIFKRGNRLLMAVSYEHASSAYQVARVAFRRGKFCLKYAWSLKGCPHYYGEGCELKLKWQV